MFNDANDHKSLFFSLFFTALYSLPAQINVDTNARLTPWLIDCFERSEDSISLFLFPIFVEMFSFMFQCVFYVTWCQEIN